MSFKEKQPQNRGSPQLRRPRTAKGDPSHCLLFWWHLPETALQSLGLVTITSRWDQQAPFVPWPVALPGQTSSWGPAVTPWGQNKVQGQSLCATRQQ